MKIPNLNATELYFFRIQNEECAVENLEHMDNVITHQLAMIDRMSSTVWYKANKAQA